MKSIITIWLIILSMVFGTFNAQALLPIRASGWTTTIDPATARSALGIYSITETVNLLNAASNTLNSSKIDVYFGSGISNTFVVPFILGGYIGTDQEVRSPVTVGGLNLNYRYVDNGDGFYGGGAVGTGSRINFMADGGVNLGGFFFSDEYGAPSMEYRYGGTNTWNGATFGALFNYNLMNYGTMKLLFPGFTELNAASNTLWTSISSGASTAQLNVASNMVHSALIATNNILVALKQPAAPELTNLTASLLAITNLIATKQGGTLYLSNLNAWAISNIISANANITLATNNGVLTITGVATNFDASGLTARLNQADITNAVQQAALVGLTNMFTLTDSTNAVQQAALVGLTNSLATKQNGTLYLTNLAAWGISNIISANSTLTIATNNGVLTFTDNGVASGATNYVSTTNGIATQLTNRGGFFTGSLTTTNSTNTTIYASSTITAAGQIATTAAIMWVPAGYYFGIGNGSIFTAFGQGTSGNYDEVAFYRSDSGLLGMFQFGAGTGAGTPALMVTNGNMFLGNATRTFNSSTTNSTTVAGLRVGFQAFSAVLTNTFTTNVVWDFPSTSVGAVADLGATITGVKDGDTVIIAPPQAAMTGIIGSYSGFASNGVAYGRFLPLAATQDPASATFRVIVHQYR